ncbi:MAG TPA: DNA translocase FtsK, partial [Pirellulaceae bacterium]|nr:DNA translocase FtsK [Pirellulaceae bacterium]
MPSPRRLPTDIVAVALLAGIVFLVAALGTYHPRDPIPQLGPAATMFQPDQVTFPLHERAHNACGPFGAWLAAWLYQTIGLGSLLLLLGLIGIDVALFRHQMVESAWLKTCGWVLTLLGSTALASFFVPWTPWTPVLGAGGALGTMIHATLSYYLANVGSLILAGCLLIVGLLWWTEYLVFQAGRFVFAPALVATSSLLPLGLLHRFLLWFNRARPNRASTSNNSAHERVHHSDLPRTIRIKSRQHSPGDATSSLKDQSADQDDEEASDESDYPPTIPLVTKRTFEDELEDDEADDSDLCDAAEEEALDEPVQPPSVKPGGGAVPTKRPSERDQVMAELNQAASSDHLAEYELPSIDMLLAGDSISFDIQKREALLKAEVLERTCAEFGYQVRVVEIETGPVISQYEIQLEAGLRLQRVAALADDLAIALRVPSVRIVAPIPGKNTVGVEVPNETRQLVRLREVIEQSEIKTRKMKIPLFLGKDAVGAPLVVDLTTLPHLLIAGRTGTGKSVCLNAIITSILMTRRPDEVRLLMIDPKMVELSGYGRLPHLMHPVVTDMRKAEAILAWAVDKMEERYALLARAGVRHVTSYNQLGAEELYERLQIENEDEREQVPLNLPFIVIVADEMADLMMTSGKEVEQHIIRLAQKSRAVGIHLILATQKPTVDVITGLIKSNLPARIAFQVASKVDSRVVLDAMGADKLLGNGDMLFLWPGTSTLIRGQGTYLTDDEIESVTDAVSTSEQQFVDELLHIKVAPKEGESSGGARPANRDELYDSAVETVIREGRGSVSLLQRALGIGYGRAARLIDYMEEDGIVGAYNGSKSRDIIMTMDQWLTMQSGESTSMNQLDPPAPVKVIPNATPRRITKLAAAQANRKANPPAELEADAIDDDHESPLAPHAD